MAKKLNFKNDATLIRRICEEKFFEIVGGEISTHNFDEKKQEVNLWMFYCVDFLRRWTKLDTEKCMSYVGYLINDAKSKQEASEE